MEKNLLKKFIANLIYMTIISIVIFSFTAFYREKNAAKVNMEHLLDQIRDSHKAIEKEMSEQIGIYVTNYIQSLNVLDYTISENKEFLNQEKLSELRTHSNVEDIYLLDKSGKIVYSSNPNVIGKKLLKNSDSAEILSLTQFLFSDERRILLDAEEIIEGVTSLDYFVQPSTVDGCALTMIGTNSSLLDDIEENLTLESHIANVPTDDKTFFIVLEKETGKILGKTKNDKHLKNISQITDKETLNTLLDSSEVLKTLKLNNFHLFAKSIILDDIALVCFTETIPAYSHLYMELLFFILIISCASVISFVSIRKHFQKYIFDEFAMIENTVADLISGKEDATFCTSDNVGIRQMVDVLNNWKTNFIYKEEQISEMRSELKEAVDISKHDCLTGLLNRSGFEKYLRKQLIEEPCDGIYLMLDIDNFKTLNDTLGHPEGDKALQFISGFLKTEFRECDVVARLGGDEFAVFMQNTKSVNRDVLSKKLTKILGNLQTVLPKDYKNCKISLSIGAIFIKDYVPVYEELYKLADAALYEAKKNGKNRYQIR